jgi:hypothetical protein
VSLAPKASARARGRLYWRRREREFDPRASSDEQAALSRSAIGNPESLWLTRASLYYLLADAGYSSVMELQVPSAPGHAVCGPAALREHLPALLGLSNRGHFFSARRGERAHESPIDACSGRAAATDVEGEGGTGGASAPPAEPVSDCAIHRSAPRPSPDAGRGVTRENLPVRGQRDRRDPAWRTYRGEIAINRRRPSRSLVIVPTRPAARRARRPGRADGCRRSPAAYARRARNSVHRRAPSLPPSERQRRRPWGALVLKDSAWRVRQRQFGVPRAPRPFSRRTRDART